MQTVRDVVAKSAPLNKLLAGSRPGRDEERGLDKGSPNTSTTQLPAFAKSSCELRGVARLDSYGTIISSSEFLHPGLVVKHGELTSCGGACKQRSGQVPKCLMPRQILVHITTEIMLLQNNKNSNMISQCLTSKSQWQTYHERHTTKAKTNA
eukprot:1452546-Amphidinium_carterae.2